MRRSADDLAGSVRSVPHFAAARELQWVPLAGGSSNRVLRVTADGTTFAMRLPAHRAPDDPRLGLHDEWRVLSALGKRGIAPEPVWHDPDTGVLVTAFQPGPAWTRQRLHDPRQWPALSALLHRVHATNIALPVFRPVVAARRYWAQYISKQEPSASELAAWQAFEAEQHRLAGALQVKVLCHNDVMCSNIVGDSPVLLDWEYAACSDPLFDLATIVIYHGLCAGQRDALLAVYLGREDMAERHRLRLLCRLCHHLSGLWSLARFGRLPARRDSLVTLPSQRL